MEEHGASATNSFSDLEVTGLQGTASAGGSFGSLRAEKLPWYKRRYKRPKDSAFVKDISMAAGKEFFDWAWPKIQQLVQSFLGRRRQPAER